MMGKHFISSTGTVDIHAALESGVDAKDLADAKLDWIVENIGTNSRELVDRVIAYHARCLYAQESAKGAPLGSERARGYSYRAKYYELLTQLVKDDIITVMEYGHSNM